jgi:hypothetical protein
MTDKDIFEKYMKWMGMSPVIEKEINGNTIIIFDDDGGRGSDTFSKVGYDEFKSGAEFDKQGKIIKAYIDSHNAYASKNHIIIHDLINKTTNERTK